jgi:hypothetical protein
MISSINEKENKEYFFDNNSPSILQINLIKIPQNRMKDIMIHPNNFLESMGISI